MAEILFLAQRVPYPPDKGDKIRSFNLLKHLSRQNRVHLGCFVDDGDDWRHLPVLRQMCAGVELVPLERPRATMRALRAVATGGPATVSFYRDRRMAAWVETVLERRRPALAYVFSSAMAQYVVDSPVRPPRVVMDFVDVDAAKWASYAETRPWPLSWLYRREAATLLAHDRRVAGASDASLFVTDVEAELFRRLAPEADQRLAIVGNGVDLDYFSPSHRFDRPVKGSGPVLVFSGAMDYWPNVDAVTWFAEQAMPALRARHPDCQFVIVGSNPTPAVTALTRHANVTVTGRVADVRPYLAHADAVVIPIAIARGIQNKVLEAMAMARPVVATPEVLRGIPARHGIHLQQAERTVDGFVAGLEAALAPPGPAMAEAARAFVAARFSWQAKLASLAPILSPAVRHAATVPSPA